MTVLFICLLLLSFLGYAFFLSHRIHVPAEFIPLLIVSGGISLLFIAGLLNILPYAAWVLLLLGIAALADSIIRKTVYTTLKKLITPGSVLLLILLCVFAVLFRDGRLVHYDNFSHWGLIVKQMALDDRLPNFTNTYIAFQSYPPGSALFLYYISKFTGYHENIIIFTQAAMTAAAVLPIFAFVPKLDRQNRKASLWKLLCAFFSFGGYMLLALGCNVEIYSLLVDALLPAMAAGMTAIALYYRDQPGRAALLTLPISAATLLLKNTGLLFAAIHFILILCLWLRSRKQHKLSLRTGFPVLLHAIVPACVQLLWSQHVALVFQAADDAKHTMSAEHYGNMFAQKQPEDIQNIIQTFLHRIFDFSENPTLKAMLIINFVLAAALLLHVLFIKKHVGLITKTLLILDGIYAVYGAGLMAMYLFSMPTGEALYLASFDRYIYTILIYLLIPFALCMAYLLTESGNIGAGILGCLLLVSIASIVYMQRQPLQHNLSNLYPDSRVSTVDAVIEGRGDISSAVVYCPASVNDDGYMLYCMRYKLMTSDIAYLYGMPTVQELESLLAQYPYLIVLDADDAITAFLKDAGIANPSPGVYTAQELLDEK